ncbi:MAG: transcriptional repressor [Actinomycetota bacterium]|nr:transcriptional repressor [Actinomycetota bacterium]
MTADVDTIVESLRRRGLRLTTQRRAIVEEVLRSDGHISPAELSARFPDINQSTVYRTLALLEELGFVSHAHLEGGPEYRVGEHDHVHLLCTSCGTYESLAAAEIEPLRQALARDHGFDPDFTHFAVSGVCARCRASDQ